MSTPPRVLILGLDGADWRVIDPLLAAGRLPTLAALIEGGARGALASVIPPLSAPAWISFLLGAGPGRHGVTDFLERDARTYEGTTGHAVTTHHYAKRTLFDAAGAAGLRVASVAVPMTYPAWDLNGVMVAGGFTPGGRIACTPEDLSPRLDVGTLDLGSRLLELEPREQGRTLLDQLERYGELTRRVIDLERFDLTMAVIHAPDNAHHCFWPTDGRPGDQEPWIVRLYEESDRYVGRVLEQDAWDLVVVMSDHGGGPRPARRLSVNRWLSDLGLLRVNRGPWSWLGRVAWHVKQRNPRLVRLVRTRASNRVRRAVSGVTQSARAIGWGSTRAFGVYLFQPYFGVQLNLAGREPQGIVPAEAFERERLALMERLRSSARERGLPVVRVSTREEAFGPDADPRLPDIILQLEDDLEGVSSLDERVLQPAPAPGPKDSKGYHSRQGILILNGRGVRPGTIEGASIEDVAPTVLAYLGVPLPVGMMGSPLAAPFAPGSLRVRHGGEDGLDLDVAAGGSVSEEEEREIIRSLRGLGYVE